MRLAVTLAFTLGLGCNGSPTAPTPDPGGGARSGTWTGTFTDAANGAGTLRLELRESPIGELGLLAGTWTATFASGAAAAASDLPGAIAGPVVQVTLRRAVPVSCPVPGALPALNGAFIALNLTLAGATIRGPYDYQACTLPAAGTLELRRQ